MEARHENDSDTTDEDRTGGVSWRSRLIRHVLAAVMAFYAVWVLYLTAVEP